MTKLLVSTPIDVEDIKVGDDINFNYLSPKNHGHHRVGKVMGYVGHAEDATICVLLWDYSLDDKPAYQSYRLAKMANIGRIEEGIPHVVTPLEQVRHYLSSLVKRFTSWKNEPESP